MAANKRVRFEVLKRDDYRCKLCSRSAEDGARLEVDHKIPVSGGGTDDPANLWVLCYECNQGKRDLYLYDTPSPTPTTHPRKRRHIQIAVTPEMYEQLQTQAIKERRTVSNMLIRAIAVYLKEVKV